MKNEGVFNKRMEKCHRCGTEEERNTSQKIQASCFSCKTKIQRAYKNMFYYKKQYEQLVGRKVKLVIDNA